jgi:hypothetical protein
MANRFFNPNQQFSDATGTPYAGGSLTFYASGTTTPLNTYQDKALTIANTNPVVLDSAGRSGNIFLQNLAYKVVLEDANSNVIWTEDPVYASDFSTIAQFQSGSGSPNGVLAGSAGSSTIPASVYWDATNQILYVCTQTGTTSTAVWTGITNTASPGAVIPPPGGYLTTVSGTPIITADSISVTNVFYTPYTSNQIPIYNGTTFIATTFTELTLTLVSAHAASTIYDFFVFNNNGIVTLVTGPAWSNSSAGTSARGSGAGTTQITRISGLWVNAVSMTARNGSTTYTVPANQGLYVGSLSVDGSAGQVSCHRTFGQSRKFGIWNAYNRVPIYLKAGDATASWLQTASLAPINGNTANSLELFSGLQEEVADMRYASHAVTGLVSGGTTSAMKVAIGFNSTSTASGRPGANQLNVASSNSTVGYDLTAEYFTIPPLGKNTVTALEQNVSAASVNNSTSGTEGGSVLSAQWRG